MQESLPSEQQFALAVENVRLVRDTANELRRVLGSMRTSAGRVQSAHAVWRRQTSPSPSVPPPQLSPRERAILELIAEGLDNEAIAERLNFGHGTIKLHVRGILAKFGTSNRTVAAVRAVRLGMI